MHCPVQFVDPEQKEFQKELVFFQEREGESKECSELCLEIEKE
jgi:hypothetical protein